MKPIKLYKDALEAVNKLFDNTTSQVDTLDYLKALRDEIDNLIEFLESRCYGIHRD